jgi:hypothetical protein
LWGSDDILHLPDSTRLALSARRERDSSQVHDRSPVPSPVYEENIPSLHESWSLGPCTILPLPPATCIVLPGSEAKDVYVLPASAFQKNPVPLCTETNLG